MRVIGRPARFVQGAVPAAAPVAPGQGYDGARPKTGKALLYMYRLDIGKSSGTAEIALAGMAPVALANRAGKRITMTPGRYRGVAKREGKELQLAELSRLGRGHYRITTPELGAGEYALVLRPIEKPGRKRRNSDPSLGELLGGTTQILYLTWDFAVVP